MIIKVRKRRETFMNSEKFMVDIEKMRYSEKILLFYDLYECLYRYEPKMKNTRYLIFKKREIKQLALIITCKLQRDSPFIPYDLKDRIGDMFSSIEDLDLIKEARKYVQIHNYIQEITPEETHQTRFSIQETEPLQLSNTIIHEIQELYNRLLMELYRDFPFTTELNRDVETAIYTAAEFYKLHHSYVDVAGVIEVALMNEMENKPLGKDKKIVTYYKVLASWIRHYVKNRKYYDHGNESFSHNFKDDEPYDPDPYSDSNPRKKAMVESYRKEFKTNFNAVVKKRFPSKVKFYLRFHQLWHWYGEADGQPKYLTANPHSYRVDDLMLFVKEMKIPSTELFGEIPPLDKRLNKTFQQTLEFKEERLLEIIALLEQLIKYLSSIATGDKFLEEVIQIRMFIIDREKELRKYKTFKTK